MRSLLALAALLEGCTGLALMAAPAVVVRALLGAEISGASIALGRVAGTSLLALAIACWPTRNHAPAVLAMVLYNGAAYLLYLGIDGVWVGALLWPVVALHVAMAILLACSRLRSPDERADSTSKPGSP